MDTYTIIGILSAAVLGLGFFTVFGKVRTIKEWLKYAVAVAENYFGSGTGQLKLQYVYTQFVRRFSFMANFVSFSMFSKWVDTALETLADWLHNEDITVIVKGENNE